MLAPGAATLIEDFRGTNGEAQALDPISACYREQTGSGGVSDESGREK
jgi:hypothetical protein